MSDVIFYHPLNPYNPGSDIVPSGLYFDLEPIDPPYRSYNSLLNKCPSMTIHNNHTYILRSPLDFVLCYNRNDGTWSEENSSKGKHTLILPSQDRQPYVQLSLYYLFWSERKTNTKLWQHDPPLYILDRLPTWYVTSGMIPIGEYTRNISVGFILRPGCDKIEIKKGEVVSAFTLVGDTKIKLKKKKPSLQVLRDNVENYTKKTLCPYTFSKQLFARWLQ
jgi:hypothetical protein